MDTVSLEEMFFWGYCRLPKERTQLLACLEAITSQLLLHEKQGLNGTRSMFSLLLKGIYLYCQNRWITDAITGVLTQRGGKNSVALHLLLEINSKTRTVDCLPCCCLWEGVLTESWGGGSGSNMCTAAQMR